MALALCGRRIHVSIETDQLQGLCDDLVEFGQADPGFFEGVSRRVDDLAVLSPAGGVLAAEHRFDQAPQRRLLFPELVDQLEIDDQDLNGLWGRHFAGFELLPLPEAAADHGRSLGLGQAQSVPPIAEPCVQRTISAVSG